jgi:hypothetical protein
MGKSKDDTSDEIIVIIKNLKYKEDDVYKDENISYIQIQNDMADTIIRHIEYYKKGDYDEWLKDIKNNTIS